MRKLILLLILPLLIFGQSRTKIRWQDLDRATQDSVRNGASGMKDSLDAALGSDRVAVDINTINSRINGNTDSTGLDSVGVYKHLSSMKIYNVKDYGAVGDGSTDDTQAIQRTIDSAYSSNIKTVYVPNDTFIITPNSGDSIFTIYSDIKITGNGTLKIADSAGEFYYIFASGDGGQDAIDNVIFDGITIDYNESGNPITTIEAINASSRNRIWEICQRKRH